MSVESRTAAQAKHALFTQTVADVAAEALSAYPGDLAPITNARLLIAEGAVMLHANGQHTVQGSALYTTNGRCTCPAYVHGMIRCKHRWAVTLYKRAVATLHDQALREYLLTLPSGLRTPYRPQRCATHGGYLCRRYTTAGPVLGHVGRDKRFWPCV